MAGWGLVAVMACLLVLATAACKDDASNESNEGEGKHAAGDGDGDSDADGDGDGGGDGDADDNGDASIDSGPGASGDGDGDGDRDSSDASIVGSWWICADEDCTSFDHDGFEFTPAEFTEIKSVDDGDFESGDAYCEAEGGTYELDGDGITMVWPDETITGTFDVTDDVLTLTFTFEDEPDEVLRLRPVETGASDGACASSS